MLPTISAMSGRDAPGDPAANAIDGGDPFLVWIGPSGLLALEVVLATLDTARYAVLRIGNPLKASLSPHRLLLQLAPDDAGEASGARDDEAGHLLRVVVARAAGRPFLLVVVEQAETLTEAALTLLQLLPGLRGPGIPTVRVAFHGSAAFCDMLGDPGFKLIPGDADGPASPPAVARLSNRSRRALLGAGSVAALLVVAVLLLTRSPSQVAVPPVPALPLPARTTAAPLLPEAATLPMSAAPPFLPVDVAPPAGPAEMPPVAGKRPPVTEAKDPAVARARLFQEFNTFVEARGLSGRLSRSERKILFSQYLASRQNAASASPPNRTATIPTTAVSQPQAPPAVVILFRPGPPNAELRANEDAVLLRRQFADVTLRPAVDGPRESTVRYFRPEDRSLAMTIALTLPPMTPDWQVEDLSAAPDRPANAAIEIWLGSTP